MADMQENNHKEPESLLIAHLRAHLVNGEGFDLLPIRHESNVKAEVEELIKSWSDSGFLLRGRFIYPWHQVRQVEVTSVEEMPTRLAHQHFDELLAAERARTQEDFWRTHPSEKDDKDKDKDDSKDKS